VRHSGGEAPARGYSPWAYEKTAVLRPDLHQIPNIGHSKITNHVNSDYFALTAPNSDPSPDIQSQPRPQVPSTQQTNTPPAAVASPKSAPPLLLDAREQYAIGPAHDAHFPTPQLAASLLPNFATATRLAYQEICSTCSELISAIEEGLSIPTNAISGPAAGGAGAELNLNFYPEVERRVLTSESKTNHVDGQATVMRRIWPHSDLGVVSALLQDGVGASGLEMQVREAEGTGDVFAPLEIEEEGDLVLLVADTLERWTNGYLRAAVHRVGLPSNPSTSDTVAESGVQVVPERRSAVMFYRAPPTANLGSLPYFVDASNPAKYENMTASEYLKQHNARLY
jgi:hypothetical protein